MIHTPESPQQKSPAPATRQLDLEEICEIFSDSSEYRWAATEVKNLTDQRWNGIRPGRQDIAMIPEKFQIELSRVVQCAGVARFPAQERRRDVDRIVRMATKS